LFFDVFLEDLFLGLVAEIFPVKIEYCGNGHEVDEKEGQRVDNVDREIIFAYPKLHMEALINDHYIDGNRACYGNDVA